MADKVAEKIVEGIIAKQYPLRRSEVGILIEQLRRKDERIARLMARLELWKDPYTGEE